MQIKIYLFSQSFVEPMLDYIITDFENSRVRFNDNSIGGMVICDSSEQAKRCLKSSIKNMLQEQIQKKKKNISFNTSWYWN